METDGAGAKSFLIRDLLRDLIVKNTENDETSENEDSGNCQRIYRQEMCSWNILLIAILEKKFF